MSIPLVSTPGLFHAIRLFGNDIRFYLFFLDSNLKTFNISGIGYHSSIFLLYRGVRVERKPLKHR